MISHETASKSSSVAVIAAVSSVFAAVLLSFVAALVLRVVKSRRNHQTWRIFYAPSNQNTLMSPETAESTVAMVSPHLPCYLRPVRFAQIRIGIPDSPIRSSRLLRCSLGHSGSRPEPSLKQDPSDPRSRI